MHDGDAVGLDVVGDRVGSELVGDNVGEAVGSEVVGDTDGDMVGSELVSEAEGVNVGFKVVSDAEGDTVGETVGPEVADAIGGGELSEIDGSEQSLSVSSSTCSSSPACIHSSGEGGSWMSCRMSESLSAWSPSGVSGIDAYRSAQAGSWVRWTGHGFLCGHSKLYRYVSP